MSNKLARNQRRKNRDQKIENLNDRMRVVEYNLHQVIREVVKMQKLMANPHEKETESGLIVPAHAMPKKKEVK